MNLDGNLAWQRSASIIDLRAPSTTSGYIVAPAPQRGCEKVLAARSAAKKDRRRSDVQSTAWTDLSPNASIAFAMKLAHLRGAKDRRAPPTAPKPGRSIASTSNCLVSPSIPERTQKCSRPWTEEHNLLAALTPGRRSGY